MIRLAVADDNRMVRTALRGFFLREPGFEWAGEASDGEGAIQLVTTRDVDLLVLDLAMPGVGGLAALSRLRVVAPHLRVIVLSSSPRSEYERQALEFGASACLEKPAGPDAMLRAIQRAMSGPPLGGPIGAPQG